MKLDRVIAVRNTKTVYRDGRKCIKVFNEGYTKSDILLQALNQAKIEETGINVPSVLEITQVDGKWAIVTEYIKGHTLEQMLYKNPENRDRYMSIFVDVQMSINKKTAPSLSEMKRYLKRKIDISGLDASTRYELTSRLESMRESDNICHGDLNFSNIILCDGVPYITDWSNAARGDRACDAAKAYLNLAFKHDEEFALSYIREYCKKSDTARQLIKKWIPIMAAARLSGSNLERREFLMSHIDIFEQ